MKKIIDFIVVNWVTSLAGVAYFLLMTFIIPLTDRNDTTHVLFDKTILDQLFVMLIGLAARDAGKSSQDNGIR